MVRLRAARKNASWSISWASQACVLASCAFLVVVVLGRHRLRSSQVKTKDGKKLIANKTVTLELRLGNDTEEHQQPSHDRQLDIFGLLDVDGDGRISRSDFVSAHSRWRTSHAQEQQKGSQAESSPDEEAELSEKHDGGDGSTEEGQVFEEHDHRDGTSESTGTLTEAAETREEEDLPAMLPAGKGGEPANGSSLRMLHSGRARLELVQARRRAKAKTGAIPRTNRTFLSFEDIRWFPAAGLAGPCLAQQHSHDTNYPKRQQYKTCSVVGAAPSSKGTGAGFEVDTREKVIRAGICFASALQKYAHDIGKRVDYCVSFWEWDTLDPRARPVLIQKTWKWFDNQPKKRDWKRCHDRMLWSHPDFLDRTDSLVWQYGADAHPSPLQWANGSIFPRPRCSAGVEWMGCSLCPCRHYSQRLIDVSSGFYAVALALELCQEVFVYGFDTDTSPDAFYGHLHNNPFKEGSKNEVKNEQHAFPLERHALKALHAAGRIKLHPSTMGKAQPSAGKSGARPSAASPGAATAAARAHSVRQAAQLVGKKKVVTRSPKDDGSAKYFLVGRGRCGVHYDDETDHRIEYNWIRGKKKKEIELRCDSTPVCVGYHWNVQDQSALLLKKEFNTSCCD
eukprot:CAMPEP_0178412574 /NCGR_PEP_ID=MMETSP0689_2-20121128/22084_1 /TAXON_ID=160604 /ORGANISM="Amphidinium massartii, Strain CS-259" /LENGTH=621 /DNA_ID=CAMNT_0020033823 /DNA_START=34 /DNA_END=1896 /DNA_ORIENTATION=-